MALDMLAYWYNGLLTTCMWFYIFYALIGEKPTFKKLLTGAGIFFLGTSVLSLYLPYDFALKMSLNILIAIMATAYAWKLDYFSAAFLQLGVAMLLLVADMTIATVMFTVYDFALEEYRSSIPLITVGTGIAMIVIQACLMVIRKANLRLLFKLRKKYPKLTLFTGANLVMGIATYSFINCVNALVFAKDGPLRAYAEYYANPVVLTGISLGIITLFMGSIALANYATYNKMKYDELQGKYGIDHLTRAYTRDEGIRRVEEDLRDNGKKGKNTVVCFLDVNNLKVINDTLGHLEGDRLITIVVETVRRHIRQEDYIIRFGGDEFVVVFSDCDTDATKTVMERVRDELAKVSLFDGQGHQPIEYDISFSIGIADAKSHPDRTAVELLDLADKYMYEEKRLYKGV